MTTHLQIIGKWEDGSLRDIYNEQSIGYLYFCIQDKGQVLLGDLKVNEATRVPIRSFGQKLIGIFQPAPKPTQLRNKGIGQALLTRFIALAKTNNAQSIDGSITEDDVNHSPFLLDWYQRNGFTSSSPTEKNLVTAKYAIQMKLDPPENKHSHS